MTLKGLREMFRLRVDDTVAPFLWSDTEIAVYLSEAQTEAAERALLLYEENGCASRVCLVPGISLYPIHPAVLRVDSARDSSGRDVLVDDTDSRSNHSRLVLSVRPDNAHLEVRPVPAVSETLSLGVYRLPLRGLASDSDEPEIHRRYHFKMLDWAVALAYRKPTSETENVALAQKHEIEFERAFGPMRDADTFRVQRTRRAPRVRRLAW